MSGIVTVDDSDSSLIYSDGWYVEGSDQEFNHTTHGTHGAGKTAIFTFTGTFVAVFGTITESGGVPTVPIPLSGIISSPRSTYSIDGSSPTIFAPTPDDVALYHQLFFRSPTLQHGKHTLMITSTVENSLFWLDYLEFMPSAPTLTPTTSPPAINPTDTSRPEPVKSPVGTIIGGVIGGLAFLVVLVIFIIWCRRESKNFGCGRTLMTLRFWRSRQQTNTVTPFNVQPAFRPLLQAQSTSAPHTHEGIISTEIRIDSYRYGFLESSSSDGRGRGRVPPRTKYGMSPQTYRQGHQDQLPRATLALYDPPRDNQEMGSLLDVGEDIPPAYHAGSQRFSLERT